MSWIDFHCAFTALGLYELGSEVVEIFVFDIMLLALSSAVLLPLPASPPSRLAANNRAAVRMQGTLLGSVATAVAVMAVAAVGFMMLTGRMNWRFGATVILGCFIIFGAASIVAGIQGAAG